MFLDPIVYGRYPPELEGRISEYLPCGWQDDMKAVQARPDFVGLNYYHGYLVRHDPASWLGYAGVEEPEAPRTTMNWLIRPEGLLEILNQTHVRYELPVLFVTENGACFDDHRDGGAVHDPERTAYLKAHIAAVLQARQEGVPIKGFFVWSLLDNFEWAKGYSKRFGIVHVDYETQERTVKDSGLWYSELARGRDFDEERSGILA
jgi:beta-glucosidase